MTRHAVTTTPPQTAARVTVTAGRVAGLVLVAATALVGVVIAAWLVFSTVTGARIVVFATGSMAPSLPQGAAALSLPVAAAEIQVGDVVTVQRDGAQRPVTHRVVSVETVPDDDARRALVLRGDDNDTPDVEAYVVDRAHRVTWGGPGLGVVARGLQDRTVRLALWAGAAGAVLWALWPDAGGRRRA